MAVKVVTALSSLTGCIVTPLDYTRSEQPAPSLGPRPLSVADILQLVGQAPEEVRTWAVVGTGLELGCRCALSKV